MSGCTTNLAWPESRALNVVGGKAASLSEMISAGLPVPPGFVISTAAFEASLDNAILERIQREASACDYDDYVQLRASSQAIRNLISSQPIPDHISAEIIQAYDTLQSNWVAVRSSATVEDSLTASWSGKFDTYLNSTRSDLLANIKKCWASLYNEQAILYGFNQGMYLDGVSVAVVVQKMIEAIVAGVTFTADPQTKNRNLLIIEAAWGLGESLVSGRVIPDRYLVDKTDGVMLEVQVGNQTEMLVRNNSDLTTTPNEIVQVCLDKQQKQKLTANQVSELITLCIHAEEHFGFPCDIEWALDSEGKFFLVQSRPITTLGI